MKKHLWSSVALCSVLWVPTLSHALYKVVGPDGKVTYTDQAPMPAASNNKVVPLSANGTEQSSVSLPYEVRQAAARYPVVLYTTDNCEPCNAARQLLNERGVPYTEKLVQTNEDGALMQKLTGGNDLPTVAIGAQVLRRFSPQAWNSYLDSAGYPSESRLPRNYQAPAAVPLSPPKPAAQASSTSKPSAPTQVTTPPPEKGTENPTGIKF